MTNTTNEFWDVDGASLQTYARNIESWGGTRQGVAGLRGGDRQVPYVPGELWVAKVPGPRTITLAGWVLGTDDAGVPGSNPHGTFEDNWRSLRNLLWRTDRQVALTKRWRDAGGVVYSAVAQVEYSGGLEPIMMSASGAKFTVDLRLAFPYFRGTPVATGAHSGSFNVTNAGDDTTRVLTLAFSGAATLTNVTTGKMLTVTEASTVTVETFNTTGSYEGIATSGQPQEAYWMSLARGVNAFALSAGTVTISYTPLFL